MGRYNELGVFHKSFIGKKIIFTDEYPSIWTLIDKLSDKHCRYDEFEYNEDDGPSSTGFGTFLCENAEDSNEKAIMKIIMTNDSISFFLYRFDLRTTDLVAGFPAKDPN